MRKHSKKFIIFLLIIITIAGFFYIYSAIKMEKTYAFFKPLEVLGTFENLPVVKAATEYGKKSVDKIGEKIKNQTSVINNSVSKATDNFKNSAFEFAKENINSGLNAMGNVLGVDEKLITTTIISTSTVNTISNKENCK